MTSGNVVPAGAIPGYKLARDPANRLRSVDLSVLWVKRSVRNAVLDVRVAAS